MSWQTFHRDGSTVAVVVTPGGPGSHPAVEVRRHYVAPSDRWAFTPRPLVKSLHYTEERAVEYRGGRDAYRLERWAIRNGVSR